ncbi:methyltransferase domain-containing protein [Daedaleopsis nitida]|nr:methyltransferase domain-containing protein [Daedaleopsis nitida]
MMPKFTLQRHPRYAIGLLALVFCGYWFLTRSPLRRSVTYQLSHDLQLRLDREERKYRAMLPQRQELIQRFGPTPAQLAMFPPNQDPWPPYTVWDFFPPVYSCPHEVDRLGALADGGKWMCGISRIQDKPDCVIYSFGIDSSYSFEATLLQSTRFCQVWIYDSTKGDGAQEYIPRALRDRAHFGKLALGSSDRHGDGDHPKMWTLKSIMAENGHSHIEFLRLDIEGWEWETFRRIIEDFTTEGAAPPTGAKFVTGADEASGWSMAERDGILPFGQLQIELHVWKQRFEDFLQWWELLETSGLRPFHCEINVVYANYNRHSGVELAEYSFLNVRGNNAYIKDYVVGGPGEEHQQPADPAALDGRAR